MVALPLGLFVVIALLWTGAWFYASATAHTTIDAWRAHEASIGRFYNCGAQDIGGYPFRIEVDCGNPNAEWRSDRPPLAVGGKVVGGAPTSPENTWFHTPLLQPSRLLFRTRNCCCEPFTMLAPAN